MTITEIKNRLDISTLEMVRQFKTDGTRTEWVSHWDNARRIRVSMHESVMEKIKQNLDIDILNYKEQNVVAKHSLKEYKRIIIIIESPKIAMQNNDVGDYEDRYERYNGSFGYDDNSIDNAFEGDPSNYWNID